MKRKSKATPEFTEQQRWHELATYNAECARGIVHTPEWDERMAKRQALFDSETAEQAAWAADAHAGQRRKDIGLPPTTPQMGGHP